MLEIVNIILPVFGIMLFGYLATRLGLMTRQSSEPLSRFVYYLAFPSLLFVVVARTSPAQIFYWPFLLAWTVGLAITFALTAVVSRVLYRDGLSVLALRCLNATCASTAFMGVPLAAAAFGPDAALPPMLATTIVVTVLIGFAILLVEADRTTRKARTTVVREVGVGVLKNPLMVGVVLGALVAVFARLPQPLERLFSLLGAAAIPCSLFAIGVFIAGQSLREGLGEIGTLSFIKLIVHPLVTWLLVSRVFTLEPMWGAVTILLAGLPPATMCFVIAQRYDVYVKESSALNVISTILSIVSVSVLLVLLRG